MAETTTFRRMESTGFIAPSIWNAEHETNVANRLGPGIGYKRTRSKLGTTLRITRQTNLPCSLDLIVVPELDGNGEHTSGDWVLEARGGGNSITAKDEVNNAEFGHWTPTLDGTATSDTNPPASLVLTTQTAGLQPVYLETTWDAAPALGGARSMLTDPTIELGTLGGGVPVDADPLYYFWLGDIVWPSGGDPSQRPVYQPARCVPAELVLPAPAGGDTPTSTSSTSASSSSSTSASSTSGGSEYCDINFTCEGITVGTITMLKSVLAPGECGKSIPVDCCCETSTSATSTSGGGGGSGSSTSGAAAATGLWVSQATTLIYDFSSSTLADVPELSFAVNAGDKVRFRAVLHYTSSVASEGVSLSVNGPAASTLLYGGALWGGTAGTTQDGESHDTYGQKISIISGTSANMPTFLEGYLVATADGTVSIQVAAETGGANNIDILKGSTLDWLRY